MHDYYCRIIAFCFPVYNAMKAVIRLHLTSASNKLGNLVEPY